MKLGTVIFLLSLAAITLELRRGTDTAFARGVPPALQAEPVSLTFPRPVPEPPLPAGADGFDPPSFKTEASAPAIAEISRTADREEVISMTGIELDGTTVFGIYSQMPGAKQGNVASVGPLTADDTAATLALPSTLPAWSMYLVWPERGETKGRAFAVNRTEAWWLGPERGAPGDVVSVYGRNLSRSNGKATSHVYLKPVSGPGRYLTPITVNPFKVDFEIPGLPAAVYEIWTHNGHGGHFGWSGPLMLEVTAQTQFKMQGGTVVNVKRFGTVADGVTDDTQAIRKALEAAAALAPSTLYFPKGRYLVSDMLTAPANVAWRGAGKDRTDIRLGRRLATSMVSIGGPDVQFRQLTLTAAGNTGTNPLLWIASAKNTRLEETRLDAWGTAALDADAATGLLIHASELIENGSFYGNSRQVFLSDNWFRMTGDGESVVAMWGGSELSMTGNELTNADETREDGHGIGRFFVAQTHRGSMKNFYWGDNLSKNAAPRDCSKVDCNKGEQICFEIAGSRLKDDFISASADTVVFSSPDEIGGSLPGGRDIVIVGGRGAGQYRHIRSISGATLQLDRPWNVIPDETSRFALAPIASQAAIYDNTFDGRDSYSVHDSDSTAVLLYGNVYDVVVDSNRISRMRHGLMTVALESSNGISPYFLQYSNNRVVDSNSGLYVGTTFAVGGLAGVWGGLGNVYRRNRFDGIAYIGVELETWDHNGSGYNGTVFDRNLFTNVRFGFVDAYKLMWTHDGKFEAAPGERSRRINTVLYRNEFDRGSSSLEGSRGFVTMHPDNSWVNEGSVWTGFGSENSGPAKMVKAAGR